MFGVNFDITERKVAEMQLRESEARLRVATEGAALGLFERDVKSDRTVWVNDRMYEIFGRTREDGPFTRQQFIQEYLHPDDAQGFEKARQHAMRSDGNFHFACRITLKNGAQRWIQIDGKFELSDSGEQSRLVGVVADITELKKLEEEARQLSERLVNLQEEERQRIAQELHDSTMQHLAAVSLNLMSLRLQVELSSKASRQWDDTEACLQAAMNEIRTFSYLMHPPALEADGLISTIKQYIAGYANRSQLDVSVRLNPKLDKLPLQMQRTLLRILQEALGNIHRHAAASQARVDGRLISGQLHFVISDDGCGFQDVERVSVGRGIPGMRARSQRWGGRLHIRPGPQGTKVHVILPVRRRHVDVI